MSYLAFLAAGFLAITRLGAIFLAAGFAVGLVTALAGDFAAVFESDLEGVFVGTFASDFLTTAFLAAGLGLLTVRVLGFVVGANAFLAGILAATGAEPLFADTAFLAGVAFFADEAFLAATGLVVVLTAAGFLVPGFLAAGVSCAMGSDALAKPRVLASLMRTGLSPQISSKR